MQKRRSLDYARDDRQDDMKTTPLEKKIADLAAPVAQDLGLALVCVKIIGEGNSTSVQIMAEDPKTKRLGVDDCAKLSRAVSAVMDVEDPIEGAYRLEVSSPGIDRPLMKLEDFTTYEGFEAKVETNAPAENGQKRFRGILKGVKDEQILIDTDQGMAEIDFTTLTKAKLVLTDDLIKKTANL
ncbi:MAG: ribosome maturation factor RimP [Alphaproteobacteria bacterium]|nr:ribosome maturation factor RimP [Alphaproteobacteria bacterium]